MTRGPDEDALWQRLESAVNQGPGPDPARLASIRARLDTRRSGSRHHHLWLAAALATALGSTAVAALWLQSERATEPAAEERESHEETTGADPMSDDPNAPAKESAPVQQETHGEDSSAPVIFRE